MATYNISVAASADDYDNTGNNAKLVATVSKNLVPPDTLGWIRVDIDTTSLPNDYSKIITASLRLYAYSYVASKGLAKTYAIRILDASGGIGASISVTYTGGFQTYNLSPDYFPHIGRGAGTWAKFDIRPQLPGTVGQSRILTLDGYDSDALHLNRALLTVVTGAAESCQSYIRGC